MSSGAAEIEEPGTAGHLGDELDKEATSTRVARILREWLLAGRLVPGQRLSEERVRAELGVSRSTLREAYQVLIRERLLVHHLSRGVFVRELDRDDIRDLYAARSAVETAALRMVTTLDLAGLRRLRAAVDDGAHALDAEDWQAVAKASIDFHDALVGLAGSVRLAEIAHGLMTEFRLAYALMQDTGAFHRDFFHRNSELAACIGSGDLERAEAMLVAYLRDSEAELLSRMDA